MSEETNTLEQPAVSPETPIDNEQKELGAEATTIETSGEVAASGSDQAEDSGSGSEIPPVTPSEPAPESGDTSHNENGTNVATETETVSDSATSGTNLQPEEKENTGLKYSEQNRTGH